MDFASPYVYNYENSDEEHVSEDEYDVGMTLSDSDEEIESFGRVQPSAPQPPTAMYDNPRASSEPGITAVSNALYDDKSEVISGISREPVYDNPEDRVVADSAVYSEISESGMGPTPSPPPLPPDRPRKKEKNIKKKMSHWRSAPAVPESATAVSGKRWRRADTNVVCVKFNTLTSPSNMHTGDPTYCHNCKATVSKLSRLINQGDDQVWCCEFCGERNLVDLMSEEIPSKEDVTYMLQPAATTTASGRSGTDETLVIFVVDCSGSMCVTTEIPGKVKLRGTERLKRLQSFNERHEDQHLPGQRRDVTYISRLQGVQAAVDYQLAEMEKDFPTRRVALITFDNEVTVIGDGTTTPVTIAGDKLVNKDELIKAGSELEQPKHVKQTRKSLAEKLFDLEEMGGTALGPALLTAVSMGAKYIGSKVIICTDGLANVGLGRLDMEAEVAMEESEAFFTDVGNLAVEKGVSISVISIKGTDCKMVELGKVANITGGQVNIVDPLKLTQEFGNILADPIIATNVSATFLLHKGLYIRHEDSHESRITKQVGSVTADTEITFEYGVRRSFQHKESTPMQTDAIPEESKIQADAAIFSPAEMPSQPSVPIQATSEDPTASTSNVKITVEEPTEGATAEVTAGTIDDLTELPFQLQIKYTDLEGAEALRVITQTKPITKDRVLAEQNMNIEVISTHTAQAAANWALQGHYSASRLTAMMNQRLVSRHSKSTKSARPSYKSFFTTVAPVEQTVNERLRAERNTHGSTYSDDEEEADSAAMGGGMKHGFLSERSAPPAHTKKKGLFKFKSRKKECSDDTANLLYQASRSRSVAFRPSKSEDPK